MTRPGEESWTILCSLDGSLAICGGKTAMKSKPDAFVFSSISLCSLLRFSNCFGTFSGSQNKNDDIQTEILRKFCFFIASMTFCNPVDKTVVGPNWLRVPNVTTAPSVPVNVVSTSWAFVTSPLISSTLSLNDSGTVASFRYKTLTPMPYGTIEEIKLKYVNALSCWHSDKMWKMTKSHVIADKLRLFGFTFPLCD